MTKAEIEMLMRPVAILMKEEITRLEDRIAKLEKDLLDARRDAAEFRGQVGDGTWMRFEGIHSRALHYARGSVVVHGGTLWICARSTSATTPGQDDAWVLILKTLPRLIAGRGPRRGVTGDGARLGSY